MRRTLRPRIASARPRLRPCYGSSTESGQGIYCRDGSEPGGRICSFDLPEEEAQSLILCDVRQKSYVQASDILHLSPESIKRKRRKALNKIIDALTHL